MSFETTMSSLKSKISSKDIFDEEFLKEKDVALKPIEISFELKEKNDEDYLTLKNEIEEIKTTSNDKIISSYELKSNVLIIESISENTSESNFNDRIQKEIENINIQKRI